MEISNNLLAVLVIVAMAISVVGTTTMLSLVPIRPLAATGYQAADVGTAQASVTAECNIELLVDTVNFGDMATSENKYTWDNSPPPFVLKNNGSVEVDVSVGVTGTNLWHTTYNDGNFTYNGTDNGTSSYISIQTSLVNMINTTNGATFLVDNLSSATELDTINVELSVTVPQDELHGAKSASVKFNATIG